MFTPSYFIQVLKRGFHTTIPWLLAACPLCTACIDEETPTQVASGEQIEHSDATFAMLVSGLKAKMISPYNSYSSSYRGTWWATQDWGYPCYMYVRETMLDAFPSTEASWNYQSYYEQASNLSAYTSCPFYYYYSLVNNANRVIALQPDATASAERRPMLAQAHAYRALAYMDLAMMFEFLPTGIADLDAKAADIWGLTVPIVPEGMGREEGKCNPRVPFYTLYRYVLRELSTAAEQLEGYARSGRDEVDATVTDGLMARFWLTLATRFRRFPADLETQLAHEADTDGGMPLGIATADDCYRKAETYAKRVMAAYEPMTEDQWSDPSTGFNTANQAWVWDMRFTSQEQLPDYWCSIMGLASSEPTWGMPAYGNAYRCIGKALYDRIQPGDWRRQSWVAPEDAGATSVPEGYRTLLKDDTEATREEGTNFSRIPAYANLKFHPGGGDLIDSQTGMLCDIPLMRVEEMHFIAIECTYFLQGLEAGKAALEDFLNTWRFRDGYKYACDADYANASQASAISSLLEYCRATRSSGAASGEVKFYLDYPESQQSKAKPNEGCKTNAFLYELMAQKYIEFWGEGILYADYKRLGLQVNRNYEGSNYLEGFRLTSKDGYCAPWLNFYIPEGERSFNSALEGHMNPDPTPFCQ